MELCVVCNGSGDGIVEMAVRIHSIVHPTSLPSNVFCQRYTNALWFFGWQQINQIIQVIFQKQSQQFQYDALMQLTKWIYSRNLLEILPFQINVKKFRCALPYYLYPQAIVIVWNHWIFRISERGSVFKENNFENYYPHSYYNVLKLN